MSYLGTDPESFFHHDWISRHAIRRNFRYGKLRSSERCQLKLEGGKNSSENVQRGAEGIKVSFPANISRWWAEEQRQRGGILISSSFGVRAFLILFSRVQHELAYWLILTEPGKFLVRIDLFLYILHLSILHLFSYIVSVNLFLRAVTGTIVCFLFLIIVIINYYTIIY